MAVAHLGGLVALAANEAPQRVIGEDVVGVLARAALREALRPVFESSAPPPSSRCPDVMALWSKRLEGDLSPDDCASMEKHLEGCSSCGAACVALKRALWVCQRTQREG